jgi:hypothetical protein
MGKRSSTVVGFRYYFGLQMGVGLCEHDELVEIKVGDRSAWSGSVTDNASITINAPNLFGGDDKEGGIVGTLDVMMGGPTQPVNSRLAAMLGGLVPAFRGITTLFFDGLMCSMSAYPKPWKMRWRRSQKGWDGPTWYPEKATVVLAGGAIKAMNPAHILYQCLTDRRMRGLPRARLDDASYRVAADKLYAEGFGLCLRWRRTDSLANFVQTILNHIGAAQFTDRTTGLVKLRLIRDDYDPATLPLFTYDSGLLGIDDDDSGAQPAGTNEVIVKYVRPGDGSDGQVRVQNGASIQSTGAIAGTTTDYPGIPTPELALRVAQRDLRAAAGFVKRFKVRLDRRGYQVEPGSVFRISDPQRNINNMVLRAGRIEDGVLTNGTITITALQDVFGLPTTSYVGVQPPGWTPPDTSAQAVVNRRLMEVPYRDLAHQLGAGDLGSLAPTAGYLMAIAQRPTALSMNFSLLDRVGSSGNFIDRGTGSFAPTALLVAAIGRTDTAVTVGAGTDLQQVNVGSAAVIDDEIVRIDSINAATGAITLGRGCCDTLPAGHAAGARIWFYDDANGVDQTEYTTGLGVQVKLLTRTGTALLPEALAGVDSLTLVQRQYRPYPPGNLQVNGQRYPSVVSGPLTVSYSFRDRGLQADQLIDTLQGNIGPESGTTYIMRVYSGATLKRTVTGLTAASWTYLDVDAAADGYLQMVRLVLSASRNSVESLQSHDVTVERHGLGFDLGILLGGTTP